MKFEQFQIIKISNYWIFKKFRIIEKLQNFELSKTSKFRSIKNSKLLKNFKTANYWKVLKLQTIEFSKIQFFENFKNCELIESFENLLKIFIISIY